MMQIDMRLFGYPEIRLDGQTVHLPLRKAMAVLTYLAEARAPVARDVLAALLWPDAEGEAARARLRRTLHRIRETLGVEIITADRTALRLNPAAGLHLDTQRFEEACSTGDFEAASKLYGADFLAGFSIEDCPEFEEWAFFQREALRSRLFHALERLIEMRNHAGAHRDAILHATRFAALDPLSETAHRHLIRSHMLAGDSAAAKREYENCARLLLKELDVLPDPATEALLNQPAGPSNFIPPQTSYANSNGVHLAFQTVGNGAIDIVFVPGFVTHVERVWDDRRCKAFLTALSRIGRLIVFDRRGVGLSDRVGAQPTVEATAQDICAVMAAAGARKALLIGASEGGPGCIHMAAMAPEKLRGLILCGSLAKGSWAEDYPFALSAPQYDAWLKRLIRQWGGPAEIDIFAPSLSGDRQAKAWWAGLLRSASSPGALTGVLGAMRDTDVRHLLPRIRTPTLILHRIGDRAVRIEAGRHLAASIGGARLVELPGNDHWFWAGNDQERIMKEIEAFAKST